MRSSSFVRIGPESLYLTRLAKGVYVVQSLIRAFSQTSGLEPHDTDDVQVPLGPSTVFIRYLVYRVSKLDKILTHEHKL